MAEKKQSTARKRYEVKAALDNFGLAKAKSALKLMIYRKGEKVGEFQKARGSLYWWGARRQKERRISWGKFAEIIDELAYGESS